MKNDTASFKMDDTTCRNPQGRPKDPSKRENIVREAGCLFMSRGYERTSMNEVAKKAEVSKLTIYSHFADKDQLFKAVIQQRCDEHIMPESYLSLASCTVEEALKQIGRKYSQLISNECSVQLHRIMHAEAARHPHIVQLFYEAGPKRVRQAFVELLGKWCEQQQLSIPDVPKAGEQFFSLLKGEMHMQLLLRVTETPTIEQINAHVDATVAFFLAAYQPKILPVVLS